MQIIIRSYIKQPVRLRYTVIAEVSDSLLLLKSSIDTVEPGKQNKKNVSNFI